MTLDICPYSVLSLQFYLLLPLAKLAQLLDIPGPLGCTLAISSPYLILISLVKIANKSGLSVNLVKHWPKPNHPHSNAITFGVIVRSLVLGVILSVGITLLSPGLQSHLKPLGLYLILLSFFHFSEYFVTSITNPSTLSLVSFLLDNSVDYLLAIATSFLEYTIEAYLFSEFKKLNSIAYLGLYMAIAGELTRKLAMLTAGRNFSHLISSKKDPNHHLVTHGIYSLCRHPSYAGWFYWAIGCQILLQNPLCVVLFTVISLRFFKDRIVYEESKLLEFFGQDYRVYRDRVGVWIPLCLPA